MKFSLSVQEGIEISHSWLYNYKREFCSSAAYSTVFWFLIDPKKSILDFDLRGFLLFRKLDECGYSILASS